ncbi:DNA helicase [Amorphus sp. 3PC139-8]|uniref:DNA helicase n=1 Tax=Amorphus sp. 3PC139-8 TaxID=2735676 RepID=UPI00345DC22A
MRLSAPIYRLKHRAKLHARSERIALGKALDHVAREEGFATWGLLAAAYARTSPSKVLLSRLGNGDLLLLGARPGHGKTAMGLQLLLDAAHEGRRAIYFTLFHTRAEAIGQFQAIRATPADLGPPLSIVTSDAIGADFIIRSMSDAAPGTLALIDYLQLLDQEKTKPDLMTQIAALQSFAQKRGVILVFLSQIQRSYDPARNPLPALRDISRSDAFDPAAFSKTCFLHDGNVAFQSAADRQ